MKKNIFSLSAIALTFAVMAGCGGKEAIIEQPVKPTFVEHCEYKPGIQAPEWYCSPNIEGGMAAVGEAKPNVARDNNMQRTMAMANGRDELARQTQVKVQNLLEEWSRATGAADENQTYEANFEDVSRQVANQTLEGSRQLKRWLAPDGTLVLLVGISNLEPIKEGIKTSLNNDKALHQQYNADKGQNKLKEAIKEEFPEGK